MKIVHIAPPFLPLEEKMVYGGIERIILSLKSQQEQLGHDVEVLAPSDSRIAGLIPTLPSIGVDDVYSNNISAEIVRRNTWIKLDHITKVIKYANAHKNVFLHVHDDYVLPFLNFIQNPYLFTIHSHYPDFWQSEITPDVVREAKNLVALSNCHKRFFESKGFTIFGVVYNGIEVHDFPFSVEKKEYYLSLSAIAPHKGQHIAIEVAKSLNHSLIIAGNIVDQEYFASKIKEHIQYDISEQYDKLEAFLNLDPGSKIVYAGPVNDEQKKPLFANANAFLMPTLCEEPFGLVAIEALAGGTPVVALNNGAMSELIKSGETGFVCETAEEMKHALLNLQNLDCSVCRREAESRFSLNKMTQDYLTLYSNSLGRAS